MVLSCVRLCDPMDCSWPGFSVRGIFQARVLEWVAVSSSREASWDWSCISCFGIGGQILCLCATWEAQIIYREVLTQCLTYYRHFTTVSSHCHPHSQLSKEAEKWTNGGAWIMETVSAKRGSVWDQWWWKYGWWPPGSEWADSRAGRPGNRSLSFAVCRDGGTVCRAEPTEIAGVRGEPFEEWEVD